MFADDLNRFRGKVAKRHNDIFLGVVQKAYESIVLGSPITSAPGQPVGQYGPGYNPGHIGGTLRASWQTLFDSPTLARISTNLVYAPPIEDGVGKYGPLKLRSTVGGWHSVALTVAGFPRIVDAVAHEVTGE